MEPLRATIRIHDNFECTYLRAVSPNSHYIRGHLVGLAKVIFGKRVEIEETKCSAMGTSYCEFAAVETA
ncbi:MAG: hypothetical protein HY296_07835 [Thaumarchaeota archaeon]|nr:hypothetical protein [Nitrososphaerota archaeon]